MSVYSHNCFYRFILGIEKHSKDGGNTPRSDKEVSEQQSGESECLKEHLPVGNQPRSNVSQTFFIFLATKSKELQESSVETESFQVNKTLET